MLETAKTKEVRNLIMDVEEKMKQIPGAMIGDCFPLNHTFTDGLYTREIKMPKGYLVVSKIHKYEHPYFVLQGEVSVITEEGVKRIVAPYYGVTPVGTKRVLYIHEDCTWITVHTNPSNGTDVDEIEERIIAKSFDDLLPEYVNRFLGGSPI